MFCFLNRDFLSFLRKVIRENLKTSRETRIANRYLEPCMTSVHTNLVTKDRIRSFKFSYMKNTSGCSAWNNLKNDPNNSITLNANCEMAGDMGSAR